MGRTQTCNFQVTVNLSKGSSPIYGAMTLKDIRGLIESEREYQKAKGVSVINAEIWPQTANGRKYMKKDFAIMDTTGNVDHYTVGDAIPFYSF